MIDKPFLCEDGTHSIPIRRIQCAGCECYAEATGAVRWHPEEGVTFIIEFPNRSANLLSRFYRNPLESGTIGCAIGCPKTPRWVAETAEGLQVELFGCDERLQSYSFETRFSCKVVGRAWCARLKLGKSGSLSFWNVTPERPRMFFLGFDSCFWTKNEEISFPDENEEAFTTRRSIPLSASPEVQLYEAGFRVNLPSGGWLTYGERENVDNSPSHPPASLYGFVSFLIGQRTPIFWRDSFIDSSTLQRVYFGTERLRLASLGSIFPPLPLIGPLGLRFAQQVVEQLPSLFNAYLQNDKTVDLAFVLAPLWSAYNSLLTDRLALACVSLERLAAGWRESPRGQAAQRKGKFWTRAQSCNVRKALKNTVELLAPEIQLTDQQIAVIRKRIDKGGRDKSGFCAIALFLVRIL